MSGRGQTFKVYDLPPLRVASLSRFGFDDTAILSDESDFVEILQPGIAEPSVRYLVKDMVLPRGLVDVMGQDVWIRMGSDAVVFIQV